jgi:hypothetical protein
MAKTRTCYIGGGGGDRLYSVLEYFPFKPMNNKLNHDTRATLGKSFIFIGPCIITYGFLNVTNEMQRLKTLLLSLLHVQFS